MEKQLLVTLISTIRLIRTINLLQVFSMFKPVSIIIANLLCSNFLFFKSRKNIKLTVPSTIIERKQNVNTYY